MKPEGTVVGIYIAPSAAVPLGAVEEVRAVPGKGLEGDRYFQGIGTWSNHPGSGREVTFIESEAQDALKRDYGIELDRGSTRRNIVTRGVALNHLVGCEFRVGQVMLKGVRLCEPCMHLEGLTQKGVKSALVHRGGLRAEILTEGTIRLGDAVEV